MCVKKNGDIWKIVCREKKIDKSARDVKTRKTATSIFQYDFPTFLFFFCYFLWTLKFVDIGFCLRAKTPASEQHSKFESENKTHLSFNCVNLRKKSGFDAVLLINNDYCRPMCVVRTFFTVIRLPVPFIIFTSFVFSRALDAY